MGQLQPGTGCEGHLHTTSLAQRVVHKQQYCLHSVNKFAFFYFLQVQAKDVDMYGVVTNTMYHEYMYAARAALGVSAGLSMEVLLGQYGIMLATTSFNITFKRYARLCCACCSLVLGCQGVQLLECVCACRQRM